MAQNGQVSVFGTLPNKQPVERISLSNGGMTANVLTFGATVQDLRLEGVDFPLVLGAETLEPYLGSMVYFGATVGRFANRIGNARFEIDGQSYKTSTNWLNAHTLHGGACGAGQRIWEISDLTENSVVLALTFSDGEMGFPGKLKAELRISLVDKKCLSFEFKAVTDKATPCSFAHHGFFNLDGRSNIFAHWLRIDADTYLPVDDALIPTGEIGGVAGTDFDFRAPKLLGDDGIDHNFCLSNKQVEMRTVAELGSIASGVSMTIVTTEPGLQVYDGAYFPKQGLPGLDNATYLPYGGIALEPQSWPDAPNRSGFPESILRPGETYRQKTAYKFLVD